MGVIINKAKATKTVAWISSMAAGCEAYRSQYGFYPGQDPYWANQLNTQKYTGSQVLFLTLLAPNGDAAAGNAMPLTFSEPYAHYWDLNANPQVLTNTSRKPTTNDAGTVSTTIADKFSSPMPILYYPARLTGTGLTQFVMNDNIRYINASTDRQNTLGSQNNFNTYITDPSMPSPTNTALATPFKAGGFILVSAGIDGLYGLNDPTVNGLSNVTATANFKCDDIHNYTDSRN
jgi:hypothetical protein